MSDRLVHVQESILAFTFEGIYRRRNAEPKATTAATADEAARPRAPEEAAAAVPAGDEAAGLAAELPEAADEEASLVWGMLAKSWGIIIGEPEAPRLTEPSFWR